MHVLLVDSLRRNERHSVVRVVVVALVHNGQLLLLLLWRLEINLSETIAGKISFENDSLISKFEILSEKIANLLLLVL